MKIQVTQRHIDIGIKREISQCAVAIAIREKFQNNKTNYRPVVRVFNNITVATSIANRKIYITYRMPKKVKNFIHDFDFGNKVEPFEFELRKKFI